MADSTVPAPRIAAVIVRLSRFAKAKKPTARTSRNATSRRRGQDEEAGERLFDEEVCGFHRVAAESSRP